MSDTSMPAVEEPEVAVPEGRQAGRQPGLRMDRPAGSARVGGIRRCSSSRSPEIAASIRSTVLSTPNRPVSMLRS